MQQNSTCRLSGDIEKTSNHILRKGSKLTSSRILRRVLQTREDLLSRKLEQKTKKTNKTSAYSGGKISSKNNNTTDNKADQLGTVQEAKM